MKFAGLCLTLLISVLQTFPAYPERSSLYPADWENDFTDSEGRFLHDFSYSGYMNGEDVPRSNDALPLFDVVEDFGADNSGVKDVTAAIQQAIDSAQNVGGGIVYLPAGTYRSTGRLNITGSNIVLRGAGEDESFLYFTSLPVEDKRDHISFIGNVTRDMETPLVRDGENRSFKVRVGDASKFSVGDDVAIGWVITDAFVAEHGMTGTWVSFNGQWQPFFRRKIVAIDTQSTPDALILDVPLRYPAKMRDSASVQREQGYIEGCGMESMSASNAVAKEDAWANGQVRLITMSGVKDCYIYHVNSYESPAAIDDEEKHLHSCGILVTGSKRVTIAECRM